MAHNNCTISVITTTETAGDSVAAGTLNPTATLVITPNAGYNVSASSFSVGSPLPPEVLNVTFSNTTSGNTPGNLVHVNITYHTGFVMPSSNTEILIDIDGEAIVQTSSSSSIAMCLVDNVTHEGFCDDTAWPKSINGSSVLAVDKVTTPSPVGLYTLCNGQFQNTTYGSNMSQSTSTNSNWTDPLLTNGVWSTLYGNTTSAGVASSTQHTGSVTPGSTVTVFTKTFWTPTENAFHPLAIPFYIFNQAALNSGYYTVEETPDFYNVDSVVHTATTGAYIIKCDTTDVYPGMQVTGPSFSSASGGVYPYFSQDVRVASVDHTNNEVTLSEYHTGTLSVGDIVNFSSLYNYSYTNPVTGVTYGPSDDYCLSKTFTVKYTAPLTSTNTTPCNDGHVIDFSMYGGNNIIQVQSGNPNVQPKITSVSLDTSTLLTDGEDRKIVVNSLGDSKFNISVLRSDGTSYNFDNATFSLDSSFLANQYSYTNSPFSKTISFPAAESDYVYTVQIQPVADNNYASIRYTEMAENVEKQYTINQYVRKTITFASDATTQNLVLSSFSSPASISMPGAYVFSGNGRSVATWTGTITKADGSVIYDTGAGEAATPTSDGSFTNATANNAEMNLDVGISGSGSATITATVIGSVFKQPTADTTVTLDFDNFLQVKPRVPDAGTPVEEEERDTEGRVLTQIKKFTQKAGALSVAAGGSVEIDLRALDNDENKASKTLATVAGPTDEEGTTKGSLSSYSSGVVTYTADTNITKYDVGKEISFTYKATVSGVDSDPATVTILIR